MTNAGKSMMSQGMQQQPGIQPPPITQSQYNPPGTKSAVAPMQSSTPDTYNASINGIGSLPTLGMADGGETSVDTDRNIRVEAIMALRGQHPAPQEALLRFARRYGPEATRMLVREFSEGGVPDPNEGAMMASGGRPPSDNPGMIRGPGGGVDDLIGGKIEGRQDVYLSDGEFVVPARVVSALGDGSSEQGARVLHEMVDRVKDQGAKRMHDNGRLNKEKILPA
jgi:hypothetical protein